MTPPGPETRAFLDGIGAFRDLPSSLLDAMWQRMEERRFASGASLMRQEDPGDCLLVLLDGRASVSARDADGIYRQIGSVGPGEVAGEMALITGERRGADVVAEEPVRALALAAEEFDRLARRNPELGIVLTNIIAERLGRAEWDALGGKELEGYRIQQCVGRGGMAVVYEARECAGGRRVALKMMSHRLVYDPASLARFRQEADVVRTLEHENIAKLYGRFSAYGTHFLVMEFLEGVGLERFVDSAQPLAEQHVQPIVGQLASALTHVHERGLLHRDVKPGNVMLTRDGRVKLMDFGLAKPLENFDERTITHELALVGTPAYMAPEQLSGEELDPRVDIYALACLAYTLLAGRPAFRARNLLELVRQKLAFAIEADDPVASRVGPEMLDFLRRGLASARDERLASLAPYLAWARPIDLAALGA